MLLLLYKLRMITFLNYLYCFDVNLKEKLNKFVLRYNFVQKTRLKR